MKNRFLFLLVILSLLLCSGFFLLRKNVFIKTHKIENYVPNISVENHSLLDNINFSSSGVEDPIQIVADNLVDLSDEDFSRVTSLTFKNEIPDDVTISMIEKMTNIESVYFECVSCSDISKMNYFSNENGFRVYIISSHVDIQGFDNSDVIGISFANSKVEHFSSIENLTSLTSLGLDGIDGYEPINFSSFPNLKELYLTSYIEDFDILIDQIPNVTSLSLAGTNIQNKDTVYLKRLSNLTSLYLNDTYLTDIDFVSSLPNLEFFSLPWSVVDLSPLYELNHLNRVEWDAYTELFVTEDLVDYLDEHNIEHPIYHSNIADVIDSIIYELEITKDTDVKVAMEKIVRYIVEHTHTHPETVDGSNSALDVILLYNQGVCYHHSVATYTIAKRAGIPDIYAVTGILKNNVNPLMNDSDVLEASINNPWSFGYHAWNYVDYQGIKYGIDAAQMNFDTLMVSDDYFLYNFWRNPFVDDEYDINYANANYYDFNYYYATRHDATDGILRQIPTFEFSDINGINIINHVIYDYDSSDTNANTICSKVLENYTCQYIDEDNNDSITTGDSIVIKKNDIIIDQFTISTSSYVAPVFTHLGGVKLQYKNFLDVELSMDASSLYFKENNPLLASFKGDDYYDDVSYDVSINIRDETNDKNLYTNSLQLTGNEINSGYSFEIDSSLFNYTEECGSFFCPLNYSVTINVDGNIRDVYFNYVYVEPRVFIITTDENENVVIQPNGPISVEETDSSQLEITPALGYLITSIKVNDEEFIDRYLDHTITIDRISEDIHIVVEVAKELYSFVEGNDSIYENEDLVFKANGPIELVEGVYINDTKLDVSNYSISSGSTVVSIHKDYLNTFTPGEYVLSIKYNNDTVASTKFQVLHNHISSINDGFNNPQTGFNKTLYIMFSILFALFSLIVIYYKGKNKISTHIS